MHAVRAIAQLRDEATIEPLVEMLTTLKDDEWIQEDLPDIFGMIGPAAIPALAAYMVDPSHETYPRGYASNGLVAITKSHPESREEVIHIISEQLEKFDENDEEFNALIIGDLGELKAIETLPLIERAFEADEVDTFFINMDDVLVKMGLKERSPIPTIPTSLERFVASLPKPPTNLESEPAFVPSAPLAPRPPLVGTTPPIKFSAKRIGGKKKGKHKKKR